MNNSSIVRLIPTAFSFVPIARFLDSFCYFFKCNVNNVLEKLYVLDKYFLEKVINS